MLVLIVLVAAWLVFRAIGAAGVHDYFSPIKHPDRALRRRNEVIDIMLEKHAISKSMTSTAKASPLPILTD